ncbi:MAG: DUF6550 family protein [Mobilitalea sp.]
MKDKRMKRLTVVGGMIAIIVLVVLIGRSFKKEPDGIEIIPVDKSQNNEVVVKNPEEIEKTEKEIDEVKEVQVTVAPIPTKSLDQNKDAIDAGTEQKIQEDISPKPTYTPEELTDPTKKPNGEEVKPKTEDKKVTATPKPEKVTDNKKEDKEDKADNNSSGGLPGFDDVPEGGPNEIIYGDSDGDIDKQVGSMD